MSLVIMSDSNCDLNKTYLKKNNNPIIPFSYIIEGEEFIDDGSVNIESFYKSLTDGKLSTTSQINPYLYYQEFEKHIDLGKELIYIGFSSKLSESYKNALVAKDMIIEKYPNAKIAVIDSISATNGQALLLDKANLMKDANCSFAEIVDWLEANKSKVNIWFTVNDLDHLRRGGRISNTSAMIGKAAQIKPVMKMSFDGRLVPVSKVRTRKNSLKRIVQELENSIDVSLNSTIFIHHGNCYDDALFIKEAILEKYNVDVMINYIGPVIGAHTGQGVISLAYMGNIRE